MKKIKKIISLLLLLPAFFACNDFLDTPPKSTQTVDVFYQSEKEAQAAIDGIYHWTGNRFGYVAYGESPAFMLEYPTGQGYYTSGEQSLINKDLEKLIYWDRGYVSNWWQSSYYGIEACNLFLNGVAKLPDTDKLNQMKGEAHYLRAWYYFNLVRIFGNVPLKLSITEKPADGVLSKSSIKDVYEQAILPDLLNAESSKLAYKATSGRISQEAIKALLAQVYLTMAGTPLKQVDKYALAAKKAKEVIASNQFALFQTDAKETWFEKFRRMENDHKGEYIFMANYAAHPSPRQHYSQFLIPKGPNLTGFNGFGSLLPQAIFVSSFDPADLRGQEKGFFFSSYVDASEEKKPVTFDNSIYKFFEPSLAGQGGWCGKSMPLIRYAEILLTYAEAQAQSGTIDAMAIDAVNQIRTRAGLSVIDASLSADKTKFIDEVMKQRVFELCFENVAFFDMIRTQKAWNSSTKAFVPLNGFTLPSNAVFDVTKHSYFPIPLREIQINPGLAN